MLTRQIVSVVGAAVVAACTIPGDPFRVIDPAVDAGPPTSDAGAFSVTSVTPPTGSVDVNRRGAIEIELSAVPDPASVTASSVRVIDPGGAPVAGELTVADDVVTFQPAAPLGRARRYDVVVSTELRDARARPLSEAAHSSFTTADGAWSAPVAASADTYTAWDPQVVCHGDGTAELAWSDIGWQGGVPRVAARRVTAAGEWLDIVDVAPLGSMLRSLVANDDGTAVSVWYDGTHLGASRLQPGFGWRTLGLSVPATTDAVVRAAVDGSDGAFVLWGGALGATGNRYVEGQGWQGARGIGDGDVVQSGELVSAARGVATAAWTTAGGWLYTAHYAGDWEQAQGHVFSGASRASVGVDAGGFATLIWEAGGEIVTRRYDPHNREWSIDSSLITGVLGRGQGARLDVDADGRAVAAWFSTGGAPRLVARTFQPSVGWTAETAIDVVGRAALAIATAGGETTAVWTAGDAAEARVWSARLVGGRWMPPVLLEPEAGVDVASARIAVCRDGTATATWARRVDQRLAVWARLLD
jgi:hypothetical protein